MIEPVLEAPPSAAWDRVRGVLSRWGLGRDRYTVKPGLYSLGSPGPDSPVLVTANYKLSFDTVRRAMSRPTWLVVLDTAGINVWCAAGKGAFGTDELVIRVRSVGLADKVRHRTLILPQLGAVGVSGFEVTKRTGFKVAYGPVRIEDLPAFLDSGMEATPEMRRVRFPLSERLMLAPLEFLQAMRFFAIILGVVAAWTLVRGGSALDILSAAWPLFGSVVVGTVVVPALLPWIPFRAFALKGWLAGLAWAALVCRLKSSVPLMSAAQLLLLPAVSAFLTLNFTGTTTFTSQNGVNKEIGLFARPMAISALAGLILIVVHGARG
ncbi:MAG: acetyl-CoA synthase subunit gamma [Elusimicrobia bacterium]|nr:acetyl-CoA synthase subunit gamma [Elusimicrobiota bacterium]